MELVYTGKTKIVYALENGNNLFKYKDGKYIDPIALSQPCFA